MPCFIQVHQDDNFELKNDGETTFVCVLNVGIVWVQKDPYLNAP